MKDHQISPEVLDRFVKRTATADERKAVVQHLLAGCKPCRTHLLRHFPLLSGASRFEETPDDRYDAAVERATERALAALGLRTTPASNSQQLVSELESHPPKRQETLVRNRPRYWNPGLCDLLVQRSHEARFSDTAVMRQCASLAVLVAERLEPASVGSVAVLEDYRARAWAALANSLRVSGDLNGADEGFAKAQLHLGGGSGDEALKARLLSQVASLRFDQRKFDASLALIQQAVEIWRRLQDSREVTLALIQQAIATGESGRPKAAVRLLVEAGKLVDSSSEPKLALIIAHNIVRFHVYGGQPEVALRLYVEARELYEQEQDRLIRVKALWQEGLIMSALGHLEPAGEQLSAAREGLLAQGNRYEAALVSLDLAAVFAKLGRFSEMRGLAGETLREMEERGVQREGIAALILLMQAVNQDAALRLIRRAATALKAAVTVRSVGEL